MLLRSTDRGDHWTEISPDLSTNPADKILPASEGGVPGGIPWFAISSISESPVTEGVIWAGTSDGKVQVTRDDGADWTDVTPKIAAARRARRTPTSAACARRRTSRAARTSRRAATSSTTSSRTSIATDDFGATWTSIAANLPNEPINVIFEDLKNPNLLFVGNDTGVFVSIDRGARWVKMNNNMPNIPVHDLLVHPRDHDLVLGSYGRDFWITNIAPLQELNDGRARRRRAPLLDRADDPAHHVVVRRERLPVRPAASPDAERAERDADSLLPEGTPRPGAPTSS